MNDLKETKNGLKPVDAKQAGPNMLGHVIEYMETYFRIQNLKKERVGTRQIKNVPLLGPVLLWLFYRIDTINTLPHRE